DYLSKPKIDLAATLKDYAEELIEKVRIAARASVRALDPRQSRPQDAPGPAHSADAAIPQAPPRTRPLRTTDRVIATGASTGGTEAIKEVLMRLPPDCPGV